MDEQRVIKESIIRAPIMTVWKAITNADELSQWFFEIAEFRAEVGYEFKLVGEKDGKSYPTSCKIIEVVEGMKLAFTWSYDEFPGEQIVAFELFDLGESSKVRLTHSGLENIPIDHTEFDYEDTVEGWDILIGERLKEHVEGRFVEQLIEIDAPASKVWAAITDPTLTKEWIREFQSYYAVLESDWILDSPVLWKGEDGKVYVQGKISAVEPEKLLRFGVRDVSVNLDAPSQEDDGITFKLERGNGLSILSASQGEFGRGSNNDKFYKASVEIWKRVMPIIKEIAEK